MGSSKKFLQIANLCFFLRHSIKLHTLQRTAIFKYMTLCYIHILFVVKKHILSLLERNSLTEIFGISLPIPSSNF